MKKSKKEHKFPSMCRECGKSSQVGSKCIYEDQEKMAWCPTFIKRKKK